MPHYLPQTPTTRSSRFSDDSVYTFSLEKYEKRKKTSIFDLAQLSDATTPAKPRHERDSLGFTPEVLRHDQRGSIMGLVEFLSTTPPPYDEM